MAMLHKTLRGGSTSTWEFWNRDDEEFFAKNNSGKHISCTDIDDLRRFYKKMIGWGFMPANIDPED